MLNETQCIDLIQTAFEGDKRFAVKVAGTEFWVYIDRFEAWALARYARYSIECTCVGDVVYIRVLGDEKDPVVIL